jgi:hypothetical protein
MTGTTGFTVKKISLVASAGLVATALAAPALAAAPAMIKGLKVESPSATKPAPVQVGVVTASTLAVTGTSAQKLERVLKTGTRLLVGERIETADGGRVDILFRDGSSITMGPNAQLVIETFHYDAKTKTGKIALSSNKGEFRFVGGRITKKTPLDFRTPTALLGIKGGINQISIPASGDSVTTAHVFGVSTAITTPDGETTSFTRQEYQATIKKGGEIKFSRLSPKHFAALNKKFERPVRPQLVSRIALHNEEKRVVAVGAPRLGPGLRPVVIPALSPKQLPKVQIPHIAQISKLVRSLRSIKRPPNVQRVLTRVAPLNIPRVGGGTSGVTLSSISIIDQVPIISGSIFTIINTAPPVITGPN